MLAQIVTTIIGFFVLVLVLRRFFWATILRVLDQRRARIEDGLHQIAQDRAEAAALQQDYATRLAMIDQEARVKIQQAMLEGKRIGMEMQEEARAQARDVLAKSKETIELELAKAKVTLRDQMADMTMDAVERIVQQKLDAAGDHKLVESILEELAASSDAPPES